MGSQRPFRFGVQAPAAPAGLTWPALARKVEDLGYATLTVSDHFDDQLAVTPALMAAADATTHLRVGSLTYGNDYRHPVVLAKEAATIDRLSGGRLELGLGAGWMTTRLRAGRPDAGPSGRAHRAAGRGLGGADRLWADEPCTFEGRHYQVTRVGGLAQAAPVSPDRPS